MANSQPFYFGLQFYLSPCINFFVSVWLFCHTNQWVSYKNTVAFLYNVIVCKKKLYRLCLVLASPVIVQCIGYLLYQSGDKQNQREQIYGVYIYKHGMSYIMFLPSGRQTIQKQWGHFDHSISLAAIYPCS